MNTPIRVSVTAVAAALRAVARAHDAFLASRAHYPRAREDSDADLEVRLQILPDGRWAVHAGDACYDTDHAGAWGASVIPAARRKRDGRLYVPRFDSRAMAHAMITEAADMGAYSDMANDLEQPPIAYPGLHSR